MSRCILVCKNMTHLGGKEKRERSFLGGSSAYLRHLHPQQADSFICFPHISPRPAYHVRAAIFSDKETISEVHIYGANQNNTELGLSLTIVTPRKNGNAPD